MKDWPDPNETPRSDLWLHIEFTVLLALTLFAIGLPLYNAVALFLQ